MSTDCRTRAWMEIDASSLRRNFGRIRNAVGPSPGITPMVKANAYGTGVAGAVRCLEGEAPKSYGVATVAEGRELRALGVERPILVIGPIPPGDVPGAVEARLIVGISDTGSLARLAEVAAGRSVSFHTEVNTGMGRGGLDWQDAKRWGPEVARMAGPTLRWEGCFTHFHSADLESDDSLHVQWQRFREVIEALPAPREDFLVHACNSAAALRASGYAGDAVRVGIFLFGGVCGEGLPDPEAVVAVRARVVLVRDARPGTTVGYGATHAAHGPERWATLAIGYGDGLPRALGNRGHALLRGKRVPIIGRISMDLTVVDITDVEDVAPGDIATFIGTDGEETVTLEEVASHASTINYEILTGFTPRIPRIWSEAEKP